MLQAGMLCAMLMLTPPASEAPAESETFLMPAGAGYQTVFFAVIEGAYRDGLSDAHLSTILKREEPKTYEYFVYACPICTPAVAAFELYKARPRRLYALKSGGSTFGPGLPEAIAEKLESDEDAQRLRGIRLLMQRWIEAYLLSKNLEAGQLELWRRRLQEAAEEGLRLLRGYREADSAGRLAPARAGSGRCEVCTGSIEGAFKASGLWHERLPLSEE